MTHDKYLNLLDIKLRHYSRPSRIYRRMLSARRYWK